MNKTAQWVWAYVALGSAIAVVTAFSLGFGDLLAVVAVLQVVPIMVFAPRSRRFARQSLRSVSIAAVCFGIAHLAHSWWPDGEWSKMASAVFEALGGRADWQVLDIRVLPGITAMLAAAAAAGAPLGHDFCCINLSDNLKPWSVIEARLRHAAQADFAMAFYNPRSASRPEGFVKALEVLRQECGPERLITFARAVSTPDQRLLTVTLGEATPEMADMRTVVIVGNSATRRVGPWVYSPRSAQ